MNTEPSLKEIQKEWHGTWKSYIIGFSSSILLSILSFVLVATKILSSTYLPLMLVGLALFQAVLQLLFFLHVGQEAKPRWESLIFYFMVLVLLIIAIGSLWIMFDLNGRLMGGMTKEMYND